MAHLKPDEGEEIALDERAGLEGEVARGLRLQVARVGVVLPLEAACRHSSASGREKSAASGGFNLARVRICCFHPFVLQYSWPCEAHTESHEHHTAVVRQDKALLLLRTWSSSPHGVHEPSSATTLHSTCTSSIRRRMSGRTRCDVTGQSPAQAWQEERACRRRRRRRRRPSAVALCGKGLFTCPAGAPEAAIT